MGVELKFYPFLFRNKKNQEVTMDVKNIKAIVIEKSEYCSKKVDDFLEWLVSEWKKSLIIIAALVIIPLLMYWIIPVSVEVTYADGQQITVKECKTHAKQVGKVLEELGIDTAENHVVKPEANNAIRSNMKIDVAKIFETDIIVDGEVITTSTRNVLVKDLLDANGIVLANIDEVNPKRDDLVKEGEDVEVIRVEYKNSTEIIKSKVKERVYAEDSSIQIGRVVTTQEGIDEELEVIYKNKYENGKYAEREILSETVLVEGVPEVVKWGTKMGYQSPPPGDYEKVYKHKRAVAYWVSGTAHGSYGGRCQYGTCAVDPKYIPLGSKLYITGYGYAIANDVGSGVKGPMVDLWMDERLQMYRWGAQWVDIYILEYPK